MAPEQNRRIVLHIDMNSFFASVEQAANPFLRGKPIVVGGGINKVSVVAAASYEAKAYGVKAAMNTWEAKKLCPQLIVVFGDMSKYLYTSREIMRIVSAFSDQLEVFSIDECFLDITQTADRHGGAISIAREIKKRIKARFNLTCTIGISYNKLMAKLAGELQKPDGLVIINPEDVPGKLENIKVSELCGVGRKIEIYLKELGISTFGELNRHPRELLVKRFGSVVGEHLWMMGQGRDESPVLPYIYEEDAKSMGHSYTLPRVTSDLNEVKSYLLVLSEQLGRRLRDDHYRGNVIHARVGVTLGKDRLDYWGKQKKIEDYLDDGYEIYRVGEKLLDFCPFKSGFRHVGINVSSLTHNIDQISLLEKRERTKKAQETIDSINDRFGEMTVKRARILKTTLIEKAGIAPVRKYRLKD